MSGEGFRAYLDYHYPPAPDACWGGNQHIWVDTGASVQRWAPGFNGDTPPSKPFDMKEQRCFCGAIQWITHTPTGERSL